MSEDQKELLDLPTMPESEWPVYAVLMKQGDLYWHDTSWGNRHGTGEGWLMVLPWGEERERGGFHRGDNRFGVEHEDVAAFTLLNDTRPAPQAEGVDGQREQGRYCCENCGYVKGRPVKDCGYVAGDGTCKHPKNMTPECHDNACPLIPPAALSKEAESGFCTDCGITHGGACK